MKGKRPQGRRPAEGEVVLHDLLRELNAELRGLRSVLSRLAAVVDLIEAPATPDVGTLKLIFGSPEPKEPV